MRFKTLWPVVLLVALVSTFAAGCSNGTPPPPPPPSPAEQMAELTAKIETLEAQINDLNSNVERFDFENWRDVVPDVRDDAESLALTVDELSLEASSLEQDLIRAEDPGDFEPPSDPRN